MYLFYTPDIAQTQTLCEEESAHCIRVLRYGKGDQILLTDGKGTTYNAVITNPNPRRCEFRIISQEKQQKNHDFYLHIAIAPTKNIERMEWMVEKCTEIGVDEITPLLCRFSERKQIRLDRLEKIILSATKQSLNPYMPKLNELTDYNTFISQYSAQTKFIAHCYKDDTPHSELVSESHKQELKDLIEKGKSAIILIGPEGDFSEKEVEDALKQGYLPVSLGRSRLRTETAAIVACHTAILLNQ